ncbi:hypothetical protein HZA55_07845 [Candidatus Poribacteria bacterium]|nr:hypothetical protein [Candidatus Poribacteria bacterium]
MRLDKNYIIIALLLFALLFEKIYAMEKVSESPSASLEQKVKELPPVPNIHNTGFQCNECHVKEAIEGIDNPETVILVEKNNIIALCNKCHEGKNLHPVGSDPLLSKISIKIPPYLPLGLSGTFKGKIVCTTCHLIHADDARDKLLRNFARTYKKDKQQAGPIFKERRDLCMSCHEKEFITKSPHKKEPGTCAYCHSTDPAKVDDVSKTYAKDILRLCTFCHESTTEKHYEKNNPFIDEELKDDIKKANFFLSDNKVVCTTCHEPHGQSPYPNALRDVFINLAEKSKYTNPHWKGVFCLSCHESTPEEGKKNIRFNGNINRACMWCHITKPTAVADIHAVNVELKISEFMKLPQGFPLIDNKLTCITCHNPRLQEKIDKITRKDNRQFLRGETYNIGETRSQSCFQCHVQQQFAMLNAHDQIDDQGELVEDSCKYCHTSTPDRDADGLEKIDPGIANLSGLCFRCHSDGYHPGKKNHIVKIVGDKLERRIAYEKKADVTFPLDAKGGVFCATCHNPHENGIGKNPKTIKGADAHKRTRLPIQGGFLCFTCHDKDAEKLEKYTSGE